MINNPNDDAAQRKSAGQTPTTASGALEQGSHDIDHHPKMKAAGANTMPRAQIFDGMQKPVTFLKFTY